MPEELWKPCPADFDFRPHDLLLLRYGRGVAKYMKGNLRGGDGDVTAAQALKPDIADYMATLGIRLQNLQ